MFFTPFSKLHFSKTKINLEKKNIIPIQTFHHICHSNELDILTSTWEILPSHGWYIKIPWLTLGQFAIYISNPWQLINTAQFKALMLHLTLGENPSYTGSHYKILTNVDPLVIHLFFKTPGMFEWLVSFNLIAHFSSQTISITNYFDIIEFQVKIKIKCNKNSMCADLLIHTEYWLVGVLQKCREKNLDNVIV